MRIAVDKLLLADDELGRNGPTVLEFEGNEQWNLQVAQAMRAPAPLFYDRGNELTQFSFRTQTLFEEHVDAQMWALEAPYRVPRIGDVSIYAGGQARYSLLQAAVRVTEFSWRGVTVFLGYEITGGQLIRQLDQKGNLV